MTTTNYSPPLFLSLTAADKDRNNLVLSTRDIESVKQVHSKDSTIVTLRSGAVFWVVDTVESIAGQINLPKFMERPNAR